MHFILRGHERFFTSLLFYRFGNTKARKKTLFRSIFRCVKRKREFYKRPTKNIIHFCGAHKFSSVYSHLNATHLPHKIPCTLNCVVRNSR